MVEFTVYPSLDLRQGRIVRLAQGDPDRETDYGNDPIRVARQWEAAGARWLHLVNLDGAFGEAGVENQRALSQILETAFLVQLGGGIRDITSLSRALELGVSRVVVGTAYVEAPGFVTAALDRYGPERVALGIDARDGVARIHGRQKAAPLRATDLALRWAADGGRWLIFTDISRDGVGRGVNVDATAMLARETGLSVIASGGVRALDDVRQAQEATLAGIIIGRALHEGQVDLGTALALTQQKSQEA